MGLKLAHAVLNSDLPKHLRFLATDLALRDQDDPAKRGTIFIGNAALARDLGASICTVKRQKRQLVKMGLLVLISRAGHQHVAATYRFDESGLPCRLVADITSVPESNAKAPITNKPVLMLTAPPAVALNVPGAEAPSITGEAHPCTIAAGVTGDTAPQDQGARMPPAGCMGAPSLGARATPENKYNQISKQEPENFRNGLGAVEIAPSVRERVSKAPPLSVVLERVAHLRQSNEEAKRRMSNHG